MEKTPRKAQATIELTSLQAILLDSSSFWNSTLFQDFQMLSNKQILCGPAFFSFFENGPVKTDSQGYSPEKVA